MGGKTHSTNYPGHERLYRERRASGANGWDDATTTAANIALLQEIGEAGWFPSSGSMLEIGCGAGNLTNWFAQQGWRANGIDIAPTAIQWARDRATQEGADIDFKVGDARTLAPFVDQRFDLVLDGHCLHCIIGADRAQFLHSARRVLSDSGRLIIMTMSGPFPVLGAPNLGFDADSRCQIIGGKAVRYFGDAEAIRAEVEDAGFEICHYREDPRPNESEADHLLISARPCP